MARCIQPFRDQPNRAAESIGIGKKKLKKIGAVTALYGTLAGEPSSLSPRSLALMHSCHNTGGAALETARFNSTWQFRAAACPRPARRARLGRATKHRAHGADQYISGRGIGCKERLSPKIFQVAFQP